MMPAYVSFFGFKDAPFSKEIADADLWLPSSKTAVVDELCETLSERGSAVLVGEPGVGKTCVLRALRHRLQPNAGFRLTYCHNATLGRRDFYRLLCHALGLSPSASAAVREAARRKKKLVERDILARVLDLDADREAA